MTAKEIEWAGVALFFRLITFYAPIIIVAFLMLVLLKKYRFPTLNIERAALLITFTVIAADMVLMDVFDITLFLFK